MILRLQRDHESGRFDDGDLARVLQDATDRYAGKTGARRINSSLRTLEVTTILRARKQGVSSLNEFRKYLGLKGNAHTFLMLFLC